jgi:hypothetical protein
MEIEYNWWFYNQYLGFNMQVEDHYSLLLDIQSPWDITSVDLKITEGR